MTLLRNFISLTKGFGRTVRPAAAVLLLLLGNYSLVAAGQLPNSAQLLSVAADKEQSQHDAGTQEDASSSSVLEPQAGGAPLPDSSTAASSEPLQHNKPPVETSVPDWGGIRRDVAMLVGAQAGAVGLLYVLPESVTGWSDESKRDKFKNYPKNFVNPVFDDDEYYLNYVLHPYWGASYYIRGRERGLDKVQSFMYSALLSAMFEFGVECVFEKPSIQDLIVTPVAGSLVGVFIFEPWRSSIKRKQELRWYDHATLVITDPIGVLSKGVERIFGIQSTVRLDYTLPVVSIDSNDRHGDARSGRFDLSVHVPLQ